MCVSVSKREKKIRTCVPNREEKYLNYIKVHLIYFLEGYLS